MHEADLAFDMPSAAVASAVARALAVELADGPADATVTCRAHGARVQARIEARDLSGLRAALTGLVRLADAALRSASPPP